MNKRIGTLTLCFILIFGLLPHAKVKAAIGSVTINGDAVNIREGPGLSYPLVINVKRGDKFSILDEKGDWSKLQLSNGKTGWVANWLVSKSNQLLTSGTSNTDDPSATANTNQLRVRSGPGTSFQIVGYLNKGQKVTVLYKNENWIKITASFGSGWVASQYLDLKSVQTQTSTIDNKKELQVGLVVGDKLNVRSNPSLSSTVLGKLSKGMTVPIYSQKDNWLEIRFSNQKAWVSSQFITIKTDRPSPTPSSPKSGTVGTVTANGIHIRSGSSLNTKIIGTVNKGQHFTIVEEVNNWDKIEYKSGTYGWVAGWYLDKSSPSNTSIPQKTGKESTVTILHNGSNIRKSPNVQSDVLQIVNEGDTFKVAEITNQWYAVKLKNGVTGYIAGWLVSINGSSPQIEKPGAESYLKNKTIVVDPGHGGIDNGTTGVSGTLEKELTLRTAKLLYDKLKASGVNVILTRSIDAYISLPSRVSTSRFQQADAFISLHYDSNTNRSVRGMTGYYYYSSQKPLAQYIYSSTLNQTKVKDRGVRFGDFHVIRENSQKATLLELGYLSNPEEELTLTSGLFQEGAATGIYDGLARYFKDN
ncbi:SH3 domain-containing protein [Neobacillus sp. PS3-40]|uniref:SH3 domain-containing protein n=1 Tax=Neobacillus sp. PS3-40 TaxID=3070679 RepID=UPI0027E06DCB|nr:SH3 domain-containing protein [Neobacillus sp. PS3-40]WML45509.1 SH3 domain-containing protein [Neobacillus sp. PS3-40]